MRSMFRSVLAAALVACALSAIASASASASTRHFYVNGVKLTEGVQENVVSKGTASFVLKWELFGGLTFNVECKTEEGKGTIENPVGGGNGTGTVTIALSGCAVIEPTGQKCMVKEPVQIVANTSLAEFEAKAAEEFTPQGSNFSELTFTGCSSSELDKTYPFKGSFYGIANNANSSLEFTVKSTSGLTLEGEKMSLKGKAKQEAKGGKTITIE